MYRDVKKKLLSVALCICMIIGAVEVVPRVKAAAALEEGYYKVSVSEVGVDNSTQIVYVKLASDVTYTYTGENFIPRIAKVAKDTSGSSSSDITQYFQTDLSIVSGSNKNAGTFYGVIVPKGGVYLIDDTNESNQIKFTIQPATIKSMAVNTGITEKPVLKYTGGGVKPTLKSVSITLDNIEETTITYENDAIDQYCSVSTATDVKRDAECVVSLKENKNFDNWDEKSVTVTCDVAYDLDVASGFVELNSTSLSYTGSDLGSQVNLTLYDKDHNVVVSNANRDTIGLNFTFNKNEVVQAGEYTVTVTPSSGESKAVALGSGSNILYTGKFTTTFRVGLKTPTTFTVKAMDDNDEMKELSSDGSYLYRISASEKNASGEILPRDLLVEIDGKKLETNEYTLSFKDMEGNTVRPTKAGQYKMYVTPESSTNYTGEKVVVYYVYGDLEISNIRFKDVATSNKSSVPYIRSGYQVQEITVKDVSSDSELKSSYYEVQYWYYDNDWKQASAYNSPGMETVGDKRIVIKGIHAYEGKSAIWDYTISQVNMSSSPEKDKFELKLTGGTSYDYTGEAIEPSYTFTYYGNPVEKKYYDAICTNNINAGTATLTVSAKTDSPYAGSMSVDFKINSLKFSAAEFIGDGISATANEYSYTGDGIVPKLKIGDYELKEGSDYTFESYGILATGDEQAEAPSALGSYQFNVRPGTNKNIEISAYGESKDYTIIRRDISHEKGANCYFRSGTTVEWNGGQTEPEVICGYGSKNMELRTDYTVEYKDHTSPTSGVSASAIVTGINNFKGEKIIYFEISKRRISNANIVVTPKVTGPVGNYSVTFSVKDNGTAVIKKDLVAGVDYEVKDIVYETEKDYHPTKDDLNALQRAGVYTVTLAGKGNYEDTVEVTIECGTNLADADIQLGSGTFTYNGEVQYPSITLSLNDEILSTFSKGDDESASAFRPVFTRVKEEKVPRDYENIYAGTVFVKAVGNTQKGYYGNTQPVTYIIKQMDITDSSAKTSYVIDLSQDTDAKWDSPDGKAHYQFTNKTIKPKEIVTKSAINTAVSAPAFLTRDMDYTLSYGDACINKGTHWIYVDGIGNFTGRLECSFIIDAITLDDADVTFENVDTYAEGVPTLILTLGSSTRLQENKDYQVDVSKESSGTGWNDTYVYNITGIGNFDGSTRVEKQKISQTTLKRPDNLANPQARDSYISSWDYDELMVSPLNASLATPSAFTLTYMRTDGTTYNLSSADFDITKYVPTKKPGAGSTITIKGKGGFNGEVTYDVNLYTDIGQAQFLQDANGDDASVLRPGGSISVGEITEAIENKRLSELVTFENIWPEETGGVIDSSCYTVSVPNGYTPKIGPVTLTIAGNHEKYYAGSRTITVTVTGALDDDQTSIEIGDNNIVPWEGRIVTPGAVKVQVFTGNKLLKGGYVGVGESIPTDWDYTVTFTDNSGVGLATATITGVNKYSGTVTKTFKITCAMSSLTVKVQNQEGSLESYEGGILEYQYKIDTEKNKPLLKLYYEMEDGDLRELSTNLYSLSYNGYQGAGNASIIIGEPENVDYQGILLGTNRVVNYVLNEISLDVVTIEMKDSLVYTGTEVTAEDLGLKLKYGTSYPLTDSDFSLDFNYAINTDDVDGRKAELVISGKGNFTGTVTKYFSITPLPIASTDYINAFAEDQIYTGIAAVPQITINQVKGSLCTLKYGKDYEIYRYLDNTKQIQQETPFTEPGTYYIRVKGLGNYSSETLFRDIEYKIVRREMSDGVEVVFVSTVECPIVNGLPQCEYNGDEHKPGVQVTYNNKVLNGPDTATPEYNIVYENNVDAGSNASVTINGIGSFSGSKKLGFVIQPKDIAGDDMDFRDSTGNKYVDEIGYEWTRSPVQPSVTVYDNTLHKALTQGDAAGVDCQVTYFDENDDGNTQTNAGKVTMTITGRGNYGGTKEFTYYIGEDISKAYTLVNGKKSLSTEYNGLMQAPEEDAITVVPQSGMPDLIDATGEKRYDIAYFKDGFEVENRVDRDQIVNAGAYYIAVVGVPSKGTYAKSDESNSCVYTINPRSIAPAYMLVSGYDGTYYYTGQKIEPKGIVVEDTDLPVTTNASDPQRRSVTLVKDTDYELSYMNNVSAGKASIVVTGKGNYTGNRVAYFNIISSNVDGNNTWDGTSEGTGSIHTGTTTIKASDIILGYDNSAYDCMMYNGYERIPTVTINGVSTSEFNITASNNINPGIATLTITGRGNNFNGMITKYFKIKANLAAYGNIVSIPDQVYTGYQITPHVTVTCGGNLLNQGSDYTVTYLNNTNVGKATVMVNATGDSYYIGTATGYFNISNTAGGMEITGYGSSYTYTGYPITPDVVVTMNGRLLNRGTDYTVAYSNHTNVGTATMTVTGIGSFSGTKTIHYTIEAKNIENCLTTAVTNYQYTGSTYTPNVTVTDSSTGKTLIAGTDYTITYSNNTNPGNAKITVTALSKNYTGSKVIPFKIISAAVSGLRTSNVKNNSIKLSWSEQDYADGYQICNSSNRVVATTTNNSYTVKGLTSSTTYKFKVRSFVENSDGSVSYGNFSTAVSAKTMLNTPTLKAKSTSKGKVTLTWTKVAKATGYEIYYSTERNGIYKRLKTISKSSARKYVDAGLASGEKYYYTIRAYRVSNGVKTYSNYNTIRYVKVK